MSDDKSESTPRPKCSVYIAASLDGFIARPDGGLDWLSMVERPGEDYGYKAFFDSVDVLVVGRKTYDVVLGFEKWPYENKRCVVVTHAPPNAKHGEAFHSGPLPTLLARLESVVSQRTRAALLQRRTRRRVTARRAKRRGIRDAR